MPRKLSKPWLETYKDYLSESESPKVYNLWAGISGISSVLKRKVYIEHGEYNIYPNQYIILTGPPGVGKGRSIKPMVKILEEAGLANLIEDSMTKEKIIETLAKGYPVNLFNPVTQVITPTTESVATIVATELPVFLNNSEGMLPFLCEMWDKDDFKYSTKNKGSSLIKNLSVGILGGCVPDYIRKLNKDATAAITSGFTARSIFIYASEPAQRIAWPSSIVQKQILRDNLIEDLKTIATLRGSFSVDIYAQQIFTHFYNYNKPADDETEVAQNFRARMKSHILKLAMILSVSESDNLIIKPTHMSVAMDLIKNVLDNLEVTFRSVGDSPLVAAQAKVMSFIERRGRCSRSEILKGLYRHVTDEDLERIMYTLEKIGFVVKNLQGQKIIYTQVMPLKNAAGGTP